MQTPFGGNLFFDEGVVEPRGLVEASLIGLLRPFRAYPVLNA